MGSSEHPLQPHRSGWPSCAMWDPYVAGDRKPNSQIPGPTYIVRTFWGGSTYKILNAVYLNSSRAQCHGARGAVWRHPHTFPVFAEGDLSLLLGGGTSDGFCRMHAPPFSPSFSPFFSSSFLFFFGQCRATSCRLLAAYDRDGHVIQPPAQR